MFVGSWDNLFPPVIGKMLNYVSDMENMLLLICIHCNRSLEKQNVTTL